MYRGFDSPLKVCKPALGTISSVCNWKRKLPSCETLAKFPKKYRLTGPNQSSGNPHDSLLQAFALALEVGVVTGVSSAFEFLQSIGDIDNERASVPSLVRVVTGEKASESINMQSNLGTKLTYGDPSAKGKSNFGSKRRSIEASELNGKAKVSQADQEPLGSQLPGPPKSIL